MAEEAERDWIDSREAARLAGRVPETVRIHARRKLVEANRDPISKRWRFSRSDVLRVYGLEPRRELAVDAEALIRSEFLRLKSGGRGA